MWHVTLCPIRLQEGKKKKKKENFGTLEVTQLECGKVACCLYLFL